MNEKYAIIVKIESQRVKSQYPSAMGGHVTVIENIGVDRDGVRWQFTTRHVTDAQGMTWMGLGENYVKVEAKADDRDQ